MSTTGPRARVTAAILTGRGAVPTEVRQEAYDGDGPAAAATYLALVRDRAADIEDADVEALRAAGFDDRAIFELTAAAAVGQADRKRAAAERALAAALAERSAR